MLAAKWDATALLPPPNMLHIHRFLPLTLIGLLLHAVMPCRGETPPQTPPSPAATVAAAITAESEEERLELILSLKANPSQETARLLEQWRQGDVFLYDSGTGIIPVLLQGTADADGAQAAIALADHTPLKGADGSPIRINPDACETAETDSASRKAMKQVSDLAALVHPDPTRRLRAVQDAAIGQNSEKLPALVERQTSEKDPSILKAIQESIALIQLKSADASERIQACRTLAQLKSLAAHGTLKAFAQEAAAQGNHREQQAAQAAIRAIDSHISFINSVGTAFRGISLGSVLLVVAIGLAITFGLMGIINMAHGELIAVGAYTTYVMQNLLADGINLSPFGYSLSLPGLKLASATNTYFILALPASFLAAAGVGFLLERSVIRFLYRRPLESLLATWGISLVLQQLFRMIFGPNNVQVSSPHWLSGNWTIQDMVFGWNRVFVIAFACLILASTWLVLQKTPLGLLIRSVMQNRNMAACMGIRTERVNMLTFCFGCGLAGLAGAFLSQIGNVGPSLGQNYIVDAFMTVVVGGVGNLFGTVISAVGIGVADQSLQQYLGNPVTGKILVLAAIILFLQWRPAGLFVTKSRSLD